MVLKKYLWILLKSTFDILLFHKINLEQNLNKDLWMFAILYMQNTIWSLLQDGVHNMNK